MNRRLRMERAVALRAAALYETALTFGKRMARQFDDNRGRAQVKGLERLAARASVPAEVLTYVAEQTRRHRAWSDHDLGTDLLAVLTDGGSDGRYAADSLYNQRDGIGDPLDLDETERRQVTLLLYREFLRQVTVQYLFAQRPRALTRQPRPPRKSEEKREEKRGEDRRDNERF